jgi:fibronectin type 3 domain-containing protein
MIPAMTWADSIPPVAPHAEMSKGERYMELKWEAVEEATPIYYNVYRIDKKNASPKLLAHNLRQTTFKHTPSLPILLHSQYAVTAVDAYGNESALNPLNTIKVIDIDTLTTDEKVKKAFEHLWVKK